MMKRAKKNKTDQKVLKEKPEQKAKDKKNSGKKKYSKEFEELEQTWNEDLCE